MNKRQKGLLIAACLMLAAAFLFPPWQSGIRGNIGDLEIGAAEFIGYHIIFSPPQDGMMSVFIYRELLAFEIILLAVITTVLFFVFRSQRSNSPQP